MSWGDPVITVGKNRVTPHANIARMERAISWEALPVCSEEVVSWVLVLATLSALWATAPTSLHIALRA